MSDTSHRQALGALTAKLIQHDKASVTQNWQWHSMIIAHVLHGITDLPIFAILFYIIP